MKRPLTVLVLISALVATLWGCSKTDTFSSAQLTDYMNLQIGKYVRYRLDSLVYVDFGQKDTLIKYQAKDVVDTTIVDNLGRPGWRIVRYLSDTTGTDPWIETSTFTVIPTFETIEYIENNLRFQKLKLPIKEGFNWKGNTYLSTYSSDPNWDLRYYDDWDYTYSYIDEPFPVFNNVLVDSTITVDERDDIIGIPEDPNAYSEKTFSQEVYARGIGLIFREFLHWEYQPPTGGNPGYKSGYGVKMVMIDHN